MNDGDQQPAVRLIEHTTEPMRCDWPVGTFVQGGSRGVVINRTGHYMTAFVEAFAENTFLRGEGETIQDAELACWRQYEALRACPTYPAHGPWDRRHYRNGSAYCGGCVRWFPRAVTGLEELPNPDDAPPGVLERALLGEPGAVKQLADAVHDLTEGGTRAV